MIGLFYTLAVGCALLAIATVTSKNILRSAVFLMGVLSLSAGLYLVAGAELLAGVQVLVYVGGVVVLLIFAIMLTRSSELADDRPSGMRKLIALVVSGGFFAASLKMMAGAPLPMANSGVLQVQDDVREIGLRLLDTGGQGFVLPFEVVSLLLLSVLIGGIVIARSDAGKGGTR